MAGDLPQRASAANYWISTDPVPLPSLAARVDAYRPLLARARFC